MWDRGVSCASRLCTQIKEARGGILFVDEAYQLTQALQRGQSDFSGEAIDEMMKVMREWRSGSHVTPCAPTLG